MRCAWQKGGQRLMENKPVTPAAQALAPAVSEIRALLETSRKNIAPVSYTHLDVYKRQLLRR